MTYVTKVTIFVSYLIIKTLSKMKTLHQNPEAQTQLVEKVTSWYKFMLNLKNETTEVIDSKIGHISKKGVSVQITIKDQAGNVFNNYYTPKSWWVKKLIKGEVYGNFSHKLLESQESHLQEA